MVRRVSQSFKRLFKFDIKQAMQQESAMNRWFDTVLGEYIVRQERNSLQSILQSKVGAHLLQLDCGLYAPLFKSNRFGCATLVALNKNRALCPVVCSRPEQLAFETESVDIVLVHHVLDVCQNPYLALRESSRVLLPGGYLVTITFNPFSSWGLRASLGRFSEKVPFNARFISFRRLNDWLQLLDYEVVERHSVGYALPIEAVIKKKWLTGFFKPISYGLPAIAAVNITVARKKKPGMIFSKHYENQRLLESMSSVKHTQSKINEE